MQVSIQGNSVPLTYEKHLTEERVNQALNYAPFTDWVRNMTKPETHDALKVQKIHIQDIDMFGPRVGFIKFKADVINKQGQLVPGVVFMRGGAVAILMVLKQKGGAEDGKEFTLLTVQPRVPIGTHAFPEIPAGMLDGSGKFVGVAAKELKEETGFEIKEEELVDLTHLAYKDKYHGMFPSPGGCDEFIKLFLYRQIVDEDFLKALEGKLTGLIEEGETITLKVLPLDQLCFYAPDSKSLAAFALYTQLKQNGVL